MEAIIKVDDVARHETRGGNIRYVLRDDQNHEYMTFRPQIGEDARGLAGRQARIEFHEEQRGDYTNVYLDAIEPIGPAELPADTQLEIDKTAWQVAAAVAASIVPHDASADDVFAALEAFKDRIAADLRRKGGAT
jgi:hypothetical protein